MSSKKLANSKTKTEKKSADRNQAPQQNAEPVTQCEGGVCSVDWKPARPAA